MIQLAREHGLEAIFLNVSFVGSAALAAELGPVSEGVVVTQVVLDLPRWFEPHITIPEYRTSTIRIVLDTNRVAGWNEIDAVELLGDRSRQWAVKARASSSYAGE